MVVHIAQIATIPVYFGGGILLAAFLFYRNKLKKPIALINRSARKIAESDLDFSLRYDSKDEMGKLCASLETMRQALEENNRSMWRMMEEHRRLNAAFAHDLRTPSPCCGVMRISFVSTFPKEKSGRRSFLPRYPPSQGIR
ncbi:hypothetical protein HMSSN036_40640 [Paenibacillus macerans]|nr:hypothetical protein HMSSN036_40640 [Paenibacillus macerans]